jgi:hypothetical protein
MKAATEQTKWSILIGALVGVLGVLAGCGGGGGSGGGGSGSGSVGSGNTTFSDSSPIGVAPLAFVPFTDASIEAPNDSDVTGYDAKPLTSHGRSVPPISNIATVTRGGVTRFGPTTMDGHDVILHRVAQGDPLRYGGMRSELSYESFRFANGEDVWFASAFKLDSDSDPTTSGGEDDRFAIQQTHQELTSPSPIGPPFALTYAGGGSSQGVSWIVTYRGDDRELYRTPIVVGQWMRTITHYRSGFISAGDRPILEAWVAYGTGGYKKLPVLAPWTANQEFGDPLSVAGSGNDWAKISIYKWTWDAWGSSPTRTVYSSVLYAGKGLNLFSESVAALSAAGF